MHNIGNTRSNDTRHIRQRQTAYRCAGIFAICAFIAVPLNALLRLVPQEYVMCVALASLFLFLAANVLLASATCPRCGETFVGNTVPDNDGPLALSSATQCRYCAHPR